MMKTDPDRLSPTPEPQYLTLSHDELPVLCSADIISSLREGNKEFIVGLMRVDYIGRYDYHRDLGVTLQYVGGKVIRCISVSNYDESLIILAMIECTIKALGGRLELAPYTVLVPSIPLDQQELEDLDFEPAQSMEMV